MNRTGYRYVFTEDVEMLEVEATLVLALWSVEALYGETQVRLDAAHALDEREQTLSIDSSTPVGRDLNRLFLGFARRDFGDDAFQVQRIGAKGSDAVADAVA